MCEIHYKASIVEFDPVQVPIPTWLERRLQRWFEHIEREPLPDNLANLIRLLRRFEDEEHR